MKVLAVRLALALGAVTVAPSVLAQPFPTRGGETGLLDVPDAQVAGRGNGLLGAELRLDHVPGQPVDLGPLPLSLAAGVADRLDVGLSMREWGQPGDPRPSRVLFGAAAKLQLLAPTSLLPGLALSLNLDRFNRDPVATARLASSFGLFKRVRLAAYLGAEAGLDALRDPGLTWGAALGLRTSGATELLVEAADGPRGRTLGAAVRWQFAPTAGTGLGVTYLPDEKGWRISLMLGLGPAGKKAEPRPVVSAPAEAAPAPEEAPALAVEDRPHFRLRIRPSGPAAAGEPRHLQHGPSTPPGAVSDRPRAAPPPRGAAPTVEEILEAQLRDQASQAEARQKRLRATEESLAEREVAVRAEGLRLQERSGEQASREQQLEAREQRLSVRGAPTQPQRQLESQEAQLAATERQLAAVERGFAPPLAAAQGAERDAADKEQADRSEVERLAALAGLEKVRARQVELRRQALAARQRMLAAMEARLIAKAERLDTAERQLRARGEWLDTWQRRLEARAERVELLARRAADQGRGTEGAEPARPDAAAPAAPAKDRAAFVMVVKSPTAVMKEPAAAAPGAAPGREAVHPGVAVEKAVAAATVLTFSSPTARISELDRESIDGIARLAAREGAEVLVWARAKDPSLMSEASRRSEEIKSYLVATASLSPGQVVTRITTRPGAQGVDVVVSALRDASRAPAQPAPAVPAAPAPSGAAPARPSDRLVGGETSRRQIRDAVVAVQPSIERCVSDQLLRRGLTRADGTLRLTVDAQGRIIGVSTAAGALGGPEMEACLRAASGAWTFPAADAEYVVDVPITVVGGSGK